MERLNEILGRAPQRRQPLSEQRAQPEYPGQGARTSQPTSAHRPQPEQITRLSQKYAPQNEPQGQIPPRAPQHYARASARSRSHGSQPGQNETGNTYENNSYGGPISRADHNDPISRADYHDPISRADYDKYEQPDPRHAVMDSMAAYRQARSQPHHEQAHIQPLQPNPNPSNEYYPDDYASQLDADVLEDDYGMMDGDWEKGHDMRIYDDENIEVFEEPLPPRNYPASIYRHAAAETDPRSMHNTYGARDDYNPRDLRQVSRNRQKSQIPQLPQMRTQEVPRHQRITQPLNTQQVTSGIARERDALRTSDPRLLRAARQAQEAPPLPVLPPTLPATPTPSAYTSAANTRASCSKCRGAGYLRSNVPFGHPNFGKPIACDCKEAERKEKRRQQLRGMSNMDAFRGHNFRTFNTRIPGVQEAFDTAIAFAENPEGWLVLLGPNGCGKTHLAAAIANQSLDEGAVVLFEAVPDLLDHLRAAFAPTATEIYDQLFSKMREAELLVLDDLGSQQSSPWANEKLFQLLNYRYNLSMPTVITANNRALPGVDERIRSRIGDVSLVKTINMERARDYRPTNPKRR